MKGSYESNLLHQLKLTSRPLDNAQREEQERKFSLFQFLTKLGRPYDFSSTLFPPPTRRANFGNYTICSPHLRANWASLDAMSLHAEFYHRHLLCVYSMCVVGVLATPCQQVTSPDLDTILSPPYHHIKPFPLLNFIFTFYQFEQIQNHTKEENKSSLHEDIYFYFSPKTLLPTNNLNPSI